MSFETRLATLKGGTVDLSIDRQVARLTLSHVAKHNALSGSMMLDLREAVIELEQMEGDLKAVVFTGAGDKAFCAGSDLDCLSEFTQPDEGAQFCRFMQETTRRLDELPVPVITRVNGVAYGGGSELSTVGDMRSAAPNARVAFVHKKMALQPGWGGAARLIKLVGRQCAVELLLTARVLSPDELIRFDFSLSSA